MQHGVIRALAGLACVITACARPQLDAFYDPPAPLPAGRPGDLIRWERVDGAPGAKAWRILYHSTSLDGRDIAVSGLVAVPEREPPPEGFPVVVVAHGTAGLARACAPSAQPLRGGLLNNPLMTLYASVLKPFVDEGYAVVAPDYQGLGAPGGSSYLVGELEARNVLDAARAIRRFDLARASGALLLHGHSQGGHAAAFTLLRAPSYAPDVRFAGAALLAPAAELDGIIDAALSRPGATPLVGLAMMVAGSWAQAYPDLPVDAVLTDEGRRLLPQVYDQCVLGVVEAYGSISARQAFKIDPSEAPAWSEALRLNTPPAVALEMPVLVAQGDADPIIPIDTTRTYVSRLCEAGSVIQFNVYPGADHLSVAKASRPDVAAWFAGRLAGEPAPSNCPSR
jgi:alpha-beta hydrolase superfamily lysophospholipase